MSLSLRPRHRERRASRARHHFLTGAGDGTRLSAIVLLVTVDRHLTERLIHSMSALSVGALTILCAYGLSEAVEMLDSHDSIDAVIFDCDSPAAMDFDAIAVLLNAAPNLPLIILGDDRSLIEQMELVEHGAQEYLVKRRLTAEALVSTVYIAIAREHLIGQRWQRNAA